ncbi:MAG TPA: phosphopantothenoylcysteine decarboxylase [Methylomirabilota bacterium]|nr:phosphopantothenoylcysteine decarboxylase [Methylomirabilota bacterium]
MNCIVTAGPTYEPLDDVRRLTNFSTGRLGAELANFLVARGHKVILLVGEMATYSGERKAQRVEIFSTAADLREKLKSLSTKKTDAIFHAAAVGDFAFGRIFAPDAASKLTEIKPAKKISTRAGKMLVELLPAPKIISELRGWFPKTKIVGWKFEADGKREDAITAAQRQIAECSTDLCVVNGPAYGEGFGLLSRSGAPAHLSNPPLLFDALEKAAVLFVK